MFANHNNLDPINSQVIYPRFNFEVLHGHGKVENTLWTKTAHLFHQIKIKVNTVFQSNNAQQQPLSPKLKSFRTVSSPKNNIKKNQIVPLYVDDNGIAIEVDPDNVEVAAAADGHRNSASMLRNAIDTKIVGQFNTTLDYFPAPHPDQQSNTIKCLTPKQLNPVDWNKTHFDCLILICQFLDVKDLFSLACVNRNFNQVVQQKQSWISTSMVCDFYTLSNHHHHFRHIAALNVRESSQETFIAIENHKQKAAASASTSSCNDNSSSSSSLLPSIRQYFRNRDARNHPNDAKKYFDISNSFKLYNSSVFLTRLTTLVMSSSSILTIEILPLVAKFCSETLETLDLTPHAINQELSSPSYKTQSKKSLLTDEHCIAYLGKLNKLSSLKLELCCSITHRGYHAICTARKNKLMHLSCDSCHLDDKIMEMIADNCFKSLHSLQMLWCTKNNCTNKSWTSVLKLTNLRILELSLSFVMNDDYLYAIQSTMKSLRTLHAPNWSHVTSHGVHSLSLMKQLRELTIASHSKLVTNMLIEAICSIKGLVLLALYASNCWKDYHIQMLQLFKSNIYALVLCNTPSITSSCVSSIAKLENLTCLDIVTFGPESIRIPNQQIDEQLKLLGKHDIASYYEMLSDSPRFPTNCKDDLVHLANVQRL